jgi:hypothetical protein
MMHQPHRVSDYSCAHERISRTDGCKITSNIRRVSGLSAWVTFPTPVVPFSFRKAPKRRSSSNMTSIMGPFFLFAKAPNLQCRPRNSVLHTDESRGGMFLTECASAIFDNARSARPNMLDCSNRAGTWQLIPMDGERSHAGWAHLRFGFRTHSETATATKKIHEFEPILHNTYSK